MPGRQVFRRKPQVMKKGGKIGITGVNLVPQAGALARIDPAGRKRSLPGSRLSSDPHRRGIKGLSEQLNEPGAPVRLG